LKDNSNISQELLETVERYHNHTMPHDERKTFEHRLQNDAEFKTLVTDIQSFLFGIEQQALTEKMDEFHKDLTVILATTETDSKVRFLHWRKIAAAVVIIVASASFWMINGSSNERLYNSYFKPDPGLPTTMSRTDNYTFFDAMVNYKQGDYKKAISKWEVLQKKEPQNDTINYFLGVAYLADKKEKVAIPYLEKTVSQPESVFNNDAEYYLGLAHLKNDNREDAIKYLKLSTTENSKRLLEKLD